MFPIVFLLISIFVPLTYSNPHCTPSPTPNLAVDKQFGDGVFLFIACLDWCVPTAIQSAVPNAKHIGLAKVPCHRIEFFFYGEGFPNAADPFVTTDDCSNYVLGSLYTIPLNDFSLLQQGSSLSGYPSDHHVVLGEASISLKVNGNVVNTKANLILVENPPQKLCPGSPVPKERRPDKKYWDGLISAYQEMGFPDDYIEIIKKVPTDP